jgi:sulfonate transport system ATP-binding protein
MHALVVRLCQSHHPAVLLVTHDVDEAILLADRVLVLTDGRLSLDVPVGLEAPRLRSDLAFGRLRARLLAELGVDESVESTPPGPTGTLNLSEAEATTEEETVR